MKKISFLLALILLVCTSQMFAQQITSSDKSAEHKAPNELAKDAVQKLQTLVGITDDAYEKAYPIFLEYYTVREKVFLQNEKTINKIDAAKEYSKLIANRDAALKEILSEKEMEVFKVNVEKSLFNYKQK